VISAPDLKGRSHDAHASSLHQYGYDKMVVLFSMLAGNKEIPCAVSTSVMVLEGVFGGAAPVDIRLTVNAVPRHESPSPQAHRCACRPRRGSYEVRFPGGRESVYFYFDDNPGRRSITRKLRSRAQGSSS
jgi:hypothetical protein